MFMHVHAFLASGHEAVGLWAALQQMEFTILAAPRIFMDLRFGQATQSLNFTSPQLAQLAY